MMIEIHMLKSFPPTNLNRDDTGSPKSCVFGGVQRGRISSQCLKRSWRTSKELKWALGDISVRTRWPSRAINKRLTGVDEYNEDLEKAISIITGIKLKRDNKNDKLRTEQIVIYSTGDLDWLAKAIEEEGLQKLITEYDKLMAKNTKEGKDKEGNNKNNIKSKITDKYANKLRPITIDIALFGRMVTSDAFANVDAAMQVAHAISTHKVSSESDYFTAVDDLVKGGESEDAGAGMIGDVEYNACCYYIYACIDIDQLRENLHYTQDCERIIQAAVPAILETMAYVNPTGKQNTFAGHALPAAILIEKKQRKIPVNYANAFVKPACATQKESLVDVSVRMLAQEVDNTDNKFALEVTDRLWLDAHEHCEPQKADTCASVPEMLERVAQLVRG